MKKSITTLLLICTILVINGCAFDNCKAMWLGANGKPNPYVDASKANGFYISAFSLGKKTKMDKCLKCAQRLLNIEEEDQTIDFSIEPKLLGGPILGIETPDGYPDNMTSDDLDTMFDDGGIVENPVSNGGI